MDKLGYIPLNARYLLGGVDLKSTFLLFDKLYFDKAEFKQSSETILVGQYMAPKVKSIYGDGIVNVIKSNISDCEFLIDKDFLVEVDTAEAEEKFINKFPNSNYSKYFKDFSIKIPMAYLRSTSIMNSIMSFSYFLNKEHYRPHPENVNAVIISDVLGLIENKHITPIFNPSGLVIPEIEKYAREQTVLEIVLSKFPIILTKNISWERIIDFKNDVETKTNQLRLQNWMIEIAKTDFSYTEIKTKLDYLINEFETHLKRHEFEFKYNLFKEVIITTAEIAEKTIKLKFGELAKTIFNIGNHKMKLMDIKENAPGKEVAIFFQANEQLS